MEFIDGINNILDFLTEAWGGILFYILTTLLFAWFLFRYLPSLKRRREKIQKKATQESFATSIDQLIESPEFKAYEKQFEENQNTNQ